MSKLVPPAVLPVTRVKKKTGKENTTWTESWFISTIRGALREIWFRFPRRNEVYARHAVSVPRYTKSGTPYKKGLTLYTCALCLRMAKKSLTKAQNSKKKAWTKAKTQAGKSGIPLPDRPEDVPLLAVIDHKTALVPVDGREQDWNEYIFELFCDPEHLHILCDECHGQKSKEENSARRSSKKVD